MQPWIFRHCFKRSSFYSEIFVIYWIESVDPVADFIFAWQTKFIQYCWLLLNWKKSQEITEVQKSHLKMLLKGGKTRARSWKMANERWRNATSWLQVPDTTLRSCTISKTSASVSSGFQTRENWWKHETAGRVLLLFSSVWNPDETGSTSFWNYFSN